VGESFRLQYVVEGDASVMEFTPPSFHGFRVVRGPEQYSSQPGALRPMQNTVYTLQAMEPGRYLIRPAFAIINGTEHTSNDLLVEVVHPHAPGSGNGRQQPDYATYLAPGEDPYEKIRSNIFLKVVVDRRNCFAGEAIVATFKLYSRLQSRSDIIRNPGFYGFAVQDMINLGDKVVNTEMVNGKVFDVHTIRKVQLYAYQPGVFEVDPMEVRNRVEFSRSTVSRKAEQEIVEGIWDEEPEEPAPGTEVFETSMNTPRIAVTVKPHPSGNKPGAFNGATGNFSVHFSVEKSRLARDEEGWLILEIAGRGNFNQLVAPDIAWPAGLEAFDAEVVDAWKKSEVPLSGSRSFRYRFVASGPGRYRVPAPVFHFFDPDSNRYRQSRAAAVEFVVGEQEKAKPIIAASREPATRFSSRPGSIAAGVVVMFVTGMLLYWIFRRNGGSKRDDQWRSAAAAATPSVPEWLAPARLMLDAPGKNFYITLNKSVCSWLADRYGLAGSDMNRETIGKVILRAGNNPEMANRLMRILDQCQQGTYTQAALNADRKTLLENTEALLLQLKA